MINVGVIDRDCKGFVSFFLKALSIRGTNKQLLSDQNLLYLAVIAANKFLTSLKVVVMGFVGRIGMVVVVLARDLQ